MRFFLFHSAHGEDFKEGGRPAALKIHLIGTQRLAEEESLHVVAAVFAKQAELGFVLHAFSGNFQMQALGHLDNGCGDRLVVGIVLQITHEASIDLELAYRELLEVAEA